MKKQTYWGISLRLQMEHRKNLLGLFWWATHTNKIVIGKFTKVSFLFYWTALIYIIWLWKKVKKKILLLPSVYYRKSFSGWRDGDSKISGRAKFEGAQRRRGRSTCVLDKLSKNYYYSWKINWLLRLECFTHNSSWKNSNQAHWS